MIIEIYNKPKVPAIKTLRLKLEHRSCGGVSLIAVNEKGCRLNKGTLLHISKDGLLCVHCNVDNSIGLQLDNSGLIIQRKV